MLTHLECSQPVQEAVLLRNEHKHHNLMVTFIKKLYTELDTQH